jgi:hypothetical protein
MFPAIESPADQRAPFVDRATGFAEINASSGGIRFQKKDSFTPAAGDLPRPVRLDIVSLVGMEKQPLAAAAAFHAAITRDLGWMFGSQTLF